MIGNPRISDNDCSIFVVGREDFLPGFDGFVVFRVAVMGFEGGGAISGFR